MGRLDKEYFKGKDISIIYVGNPVDLTEIEKVDKILEEYGYDYFVDMLPTRGYDPLGGSKKTYTPYFCVFSEQYESAKQILQNKGINNIVEKGNIQEGGFY